MQTPGNDAANATTAIVPLADVIVAQDDAPSKDGRSLNKHLPALIRLSLLGLILGIVWWTWPRADGTPLATGASLAAASQPVQAFTGEKIVPAQQVTAVAPAAIITPTGDSSTTSTEGGSPSIEQATSVTATVEATNPASNLTSLSAETITATDVIILDVPTVAPTAPATNDTASQPTKIARVLVPTPTPTATPTAEPAQAGSSLPQVRIIPAVGIKLPPTRTPTPSAFAPTPTPTLEPLPPIAPGRLWSTFAPNIGADYDHFWVGRPFLPDAPNQLASPSYQFGSTAGDRYRPHHGMDISNPFGTPVLAATVGEVVHAGPDDVEMLGPYNNFYGNTVVIRLERRLTVGDGQLDVYLLYGHLSQVFTAVGQQVQPGDVVGAVGMTGIAIGPHLHVEMRLGANTYRHSVNPYLWVQPPGDTGAVAVRLLTADGRTWPGARLTLAQFEGGRATWARMIETYLDTENIGPDPTWGENGAMDGAPPGSYVIVGAVNGERIRAELTVNAGQTTFVEIRTQQ